MGCVVHTTKKKAASEIDDRPPRTSNILVSPRTFVQRHRQVTPVYNRTPTTVQMLLFADDTYHNVFVTGTTNEVGQPPSRIFVMFWLSRQRRRSLWFLVVQSRRATDEKTEGDQSAKFNGTCFVVQLLQSVSIVTTLAVFGSTSFGRASPEVLLLMLAAVGGVKSREASVLLAPSHTL